VGDRVPDPDVNPAVDSGLPPGPGTWVKVYYPTGYRWERLDKFGGTDAVWPPPEERR
jgi:hypothetical protein